MHPYVEKITAIGSKANNTFMTLGIEPVSWGEGKAVLKMQVTQAVLNGVGVLQGGFYTILGDEAIALAALTLLDEAHSCATISETTEFLKGTNAGEMYAVAKIVRQGRHVLFGEAEVHLGGVEGKLLSKTTASYLVMENK